MSDDKSRETHKRRPKKFGPPSRDTVNLLVAVCAVLISAASFVATYVQSEAALKEVKAETWPYLQIDHGNFDSDSRTNTIYFHLENAGVGPAHVRSFRVQYDGQPLKSFSHFVRSCCLLTEEEIEAVTSDGRVQMQVITDVPSNLILPSGDLVNLFTVPLQGTHSDLWKKLDRARWKLTAKACYCSLLDECYETDFVNQPVEAKVCQRDPDYEFGEKQQ